jgi:hypothetical protein
VDFIKSLVTEMAERSRRSAAATEMTERSRASAAQAAVEPSVGVIIAWAGSDGFDRGDYEPAKVCIGPFHRGKQCRTSESVKMDALHRLLPGDADDQRRERKLRHYLEMVGKMEAGVRGCYSRPFSEITAEEFTCMLLVDGCFLLTRFLQGIAPPRPPQQPVDDIDNIRVDRDIIFLVENQLPFFVLLEIHKLIAPAAAAENHDLVIDSVIGRLKALVGRSAYSAARVSRPSSTPPHILHLLHMFFKPTTAPRPTNGTAAPPASASTEMQQLLPCTLGAANGNAAVNETEGTPVRQQFCRVVTSYYAACVRYMKKKVGGTPSVALANRRWSSATYYHAAGVSFMPRKVGAGDGEAQSILDVELRGSTLHVPCLTVDSNTFRMLRNMVALEQHTSGNRLSKSHVTTYTASSCRSWPARRRTWSSSSPRRSSSTCSKTRSRSPGASQGSAKAPSSAPTTLT